MNFKKIFFQTTIHRHKLPRIVISSPRPNSSPVIPSMFLLMIFFIISIYVISGVCIHTARLVKCLSSVLDLNRKTALNQKLTTDFDHFPHHIDFLIDHINNSHHQYSQQQSLLIKQELFTRVSTNWHSFKPVKATLYPFCFPGNENSDSTISLIKMIFKRFSPSQQLSFTIPASGIISSGFGIRTDPVFEGSAFHKGIDIAAPFGTPVFCAADGIVIFSGWKPLLGNAIIIRHNQTRLLTIYGHLHDFTVCRDDSIFQNQIIGHVGNTGKSTGPHLHFEVKLDNVPINPISFLLPLDTLID